MNLNQEQRDILTKAAEVLQEVGMAADMISRLRLIVERNTPKEEVHQVSAGDSGSAKDK